MPTQLTDHEVSLLLTPILRDLSARKPAREVVLIGEQRVTQKLASRLTQQDVERTFDRLYNGMIERLACSGLPWAVQMREPEIPGVDEGDWVPPPANETPTAGSSDAMDMEQLRLLGQLQ